MPSTYSSNLALELIGNEDQAGSWGVTTNRNLGTLLEQSISGYVTQTITDGADTIITMPNGATGVARNMTIEMTGTLTAARNLIVPSNRKLYFIYNNTSGGFAVTVKVSGQTGVSVPNGQRLLVVCNGTDVVPALSYIPSINLGSLTLSGNQTIGGTLAVTGATNLAALNISGVTTFNSLTASRFIATDGSKQATSVSINAGANVALSSTPSSLTIAAIPQGLTSRGAEWQTTLGGAIVAPLSQTIEVASKCQITSVVILTEALQGSCVIDIWKSPKPTLPTVSNSICGSNKPTITNGTTLFSTSFTGWTSTTFNPGDLVTFRLQSSSFFSKVTIYITLQDIV